MAEPIKLDDRTDKLVSVLIAVCWVVMTLVDFWNNWPPDFAAMYFAGHFYAIGNFADVYAAPVGFFGPDVPQSWLDLASQLSKDDSLVFPFVYPPIWAFLAAPLTQIMGPYTFFNLFLTLQTVMTATTVFLVWNMVRPRMPMAVWAVFSFALLWFSLIATSAFVHNQFQITVAFLTILCFERYLAGKSVQSGAILALAAAIKLSPAALFLIFLVERDKQAMLSFVVIGGALAMVSVVITGIDLHLVFLERLREISSVIAVMKVNYNLEVFLFEGAALLTGQRIDPSPMIQDQVVAEPVWITITVRFALVIGIIVVFLRSRHLDRYQRVLLRQVGLLLLVTLCAPLAWTHHYLAPLLLMPALYAFYSFAKATSLIFVIGVVTNVQMFVMLSDLSTLVHVQVLASVIAFLGLWTAFVFAPGTWHRRANQQMRAA